MITDFIYDGNRLSELGYVTCVFGSGGDTDTVTTDSQRNFDHLSLFNGKYQPFSVVNYTDVFSTKISCCKDPCRDDSDDPITLDEMRQIKRWLSPASPKKFYIPDDAEYDDIYWEGTFNVEEVWSAGNRVGFNLTFESNRPYAIGGDIKYEGDVSAGGTISINNVCDEEGYVYPGIEITCSAVGTLTITNTSFTSDESMVIENCTSGEVITVTPELQISSSLSMHKLSKDFNWRFLKIWNYGEYRENNITCSLAAHYKISYTPSKKVVFA